MADEFTADDRRGRRRKTIPGIETRFEKVDAGRLFRWALLQLYGERIFGRRDPEQPTALPTLPERLAALLYARTSETHSRMEPVEYQELADELETSRETLAALLRAFRRQGFIELRYRCIDVTDREGLTELIDL